MTNNEYLLLLTLDELALLRGLIAGEAEGEPYVGQVAVAYVAKNRVKYSKQALVPWWPRDLKRVILQKHQFSCFWEDWNKRRKVILEAIHSPEKYQRIDMAAKDAYYERLPDPTLGADHYFSINIKPPKWSRYMTKTVRIGRHEFYKSV